MSKAKLHNSVVMVRCTRAEIICIWGVKRWTDETMEHWTLAQQCCVTHRVLCGPMPRCGVEQSRDKNNHRSWARSGSLINYSSLLINLFFYLWPVSWVKPFVFWGRGVTTPCGMRDLSSLTRNGTHAPCSTCNNVRYYCNKKENIVTLKAVCSLHWSGWPKRKEEFLRRH